MAQAMQLAGAAKRVIHSHLYVGTAPHNGPSCGGRPVPPRLMFRAAAHMKWVPRHTSPAQRANTHRREEKANRRTTHTHTHTEPKQFAYPRRPWRPEAEGPHGRTSTASKAISIPHKNTHTALAQEHMKDLTASSHRVLFCTACCQDTVRGPPSSPPRACSAACRRQLRNS